MNGYGDRRCGKNSWCSSGIPTAKDEGIVQGGDENRTDSLTIYGKLMCVHGIASIVVVKLDIRLLEPSRIPKT